MTTERIDIVVTEEGSRRVARDIKNIGDSAKGAKGGVDLLKSALLALGGGLLAAQYMALSDSFTRMQNAIQLSGRAAGNVNGTFNDLLAIANRTYQPVDAMVTLFQRGAMAADDLGASNADLLSFIETIGTALATQGGSAEQASGALLQLSQALGAGTVRAEEFNSILEGAYPVALAAARGIEAAGGSVAKLRELVVAGKVSSKEFFEAINSQKDVLAEAFAGSSTTISQAFQVLQNNMVALVGGFNQTTGAAGFFAQTILLVANNLGVLAEAAMVIAVALGPVGLVMAANMATAALGALTAVILANPIGALIVLLTGAIYAMYQFGDSIAVSSDGLVTLRDVVLGTFQFIVDTISDAVGWIREAFGGIGETWSGSFQDLQKFALTAIAGVVNIFKTGVNSIIGFWVGGYNAIIAGWGNFPAAFSDLVTQAMNLAMSAVDWFVNKAISGMNAILGLINKISNAGGGGDLVDLMDPFQSDKWTNKAEGGVKNFANAVKGAFQDALSRDYVGTTVDMVVTGIKENADKISAERRAEEEKLKAQADAGRQLAEAARGPAASGGGGGGGKGGGDTMSFASEMQRLTQEIQAQTNAYHGLNTASSQAQELMKIEQELASKGVTLTQQEREQLNGKLVELDRLNQLTDARAQILDDLYGSQETFNIQLQAANDLLAEGVITAEDYARAVANIGSSLEQTAQGPMEGFMLGLQRVRKDSHDMALDVADMVENAFGGMEDALVEFVTTGKLDFSKLIDSIIADLARLVIRYLIIQPIIQALTSMMNNMFPSLAGGGGGSSGASAPSSVSSQAVQDVARASQAQATQSSDTRGATALNVQIINNASSDVEVSTKTERDEDGMDKLVAIIERKVADSVSRRGSPVHRAMKGNFGLTDTLITRGA